MNKPLAIITVVYKNYEILTDFFSSLQKQTDQSFHIFLSDLTDTGRKDIPPRENLSIITADNNGYAHGVNMGIQVARENGYKQFAVVNSDIVFDTNFVQNTRQSLQSHPKSLTGGKIYYAKGYEYHDHSYKKSELGHVFWYAGGDVDWNHALTHHRGVDEVDTGQYSNLEKTDFITGCLMAFDERAFDAIGFWDESYFMYYEDADYCERAKKAGVSLYYDPSIMIWHKNAQSSDGSGSAFHVRYQRRNRLRWGLKYAPWRTKVHLVKNFIFGSGM
jgi:hypothetical protein